MIHGWWVTRALENGGAMYLGAWCFWVILSITFHELAHGWAAIARGDPTPIETGHMTFNPVVHMGLNSLLIFALCGIAWGAMPVNPYRVRGRYGGAYVAFAGPLMNFVLAVICVALGGIVIGLVKSGHAFGTAQVQDGVLMFFLVGGSLNVALGLFNLLPIVPLDGGRILANVFPKYDEFTQTQAGQFMSMGAFIVAFFFAGKMVFGAGRSSVIWGMQELASVFPMATV